MKKIITLYQFEWAKNKTPIFFFIAIVVLFLFCYGLISNSNDMQGEYFTGRSRFLSFNWEERLEKAQEQYELEPTPTRLRFLNGTKKYKEMKDKVIASGKDVNQECYYCLGIEDDYYEYAFEGQNEWNGEVTHIEELEKALTGDFYDYLSYVELKQQDKLSNLKNSTNPKYVIEQYQTIYEENLDLIRFYKNKKDIKEWQKDLIAPYLWGEYVYIWNKEILSSELKFSVDSELKKEYKTYDNYIESMKKEIEKQKNQRTVDFYRLYHDMEPTEYMEGGEKIEQVALQMMPVGMIFTFLLLIGLFGFPLFRERKRNLVNLVKTKDYTSHQIFASKFLYYSSLLIILTFYFLVFFLIMCLIYHVPFDSMFLVVENGSVVSFTFFTFLIENIIRLLAIFHLFLFVFLLIAGVQKRILVPYIVVLSMIPLFYNLYVSVNPYRVESFGASPKLLNTQYIGSGFPMYLLCIFLIGLGLYLLNQFVWKKKW